MGLGLSSFGSNVGAETDLQLRGIPLITARFEMAVSEVQCGKLERDGSEECERRGREALNHHLQLRVMAAQTLMVSDMHVLKQQVHAA
jgi:hypothetical protein